MAWGRRGGQRTPVRIDMKGSGVLLLNLRRDDGGFFAEDIDMGAFSCHPTGVISTLGKSWET